MTDLKIDLGLIKAMTKEQRQLLTKSIRTDAHLWDAVNGVGGLSEQSMIGVLQGTVTSNRMPIAGAEVKIAQKSAEDIILISDENGYYTKELPPEKYDVVISALGSVAETVSVVIVKGVVSTLNQDFVIDVKVV